MKYYMAVPLFIVLNVHGFIIFYAISLVEKQKGQTANHFHTQLDPSAFRLTIYIPLS